jgi:hypothetical protein
VTSDGFVVGRTDAGANHFIGNYGDLIRNWSNLLAIAGLTATERSPKLRLCSPRRLATLDSPPHRRGTVKSERVALYARASTLVGQSPEMQLVELREYAARRGWQVVEEYVACPAAKRAALH